MTNAELIDYLEAKGACATAIKWVGTRDLDTAWRECSNANWLTWLWASTGDAGLLVNAAAAIAEEVLLIFEAAHPEDDRPRKAIDAAKRGDAAARSAADAAAAAADAAAYAASAAAYAAVALGVSPADLLRKHLQCPLLERA